MSATSTGATFVALVTLGVGSVACTKMMKDFRKSSTGKKAAGKDPAADDTIETDAQAAQEAEVTKAAEEADEEEIEAAVVAAGAQFYENERKDRASGGKWDSKYLGVDDPV